MRCLRKTLSVQVEDIPDVVGACCILHNICQTHGDSVDEHWLETSQEPLPAISTPTNVISADASNTRRAIMLHFSLMYVYLMQPLIMYMYALCEHYIYLLHVHM